MKLILIYLCIFSKCSAAVSINISGELNYISNDMTLYFGVGDEVLQSFEINPAAVPKMQITGETAYLYAITDFKLSIPSAGFEVVSGYGHILSSSLESFVLFGHSDVPINYNGFDFRWVGVEFIVTGDQELRFDKFLSGDFEYDEFGLYFYDPLSEENLAGVGRYSISWGLVNPIPEPNFLTLLFVSCIFLLNSRRRF